MQRAIVLSINQRKIKNKNNKNKLKRQLIFSVVCFCLLVSQVMYARLFLGENINSIIVSASKVFNPLVQLYSEEQDGYFVSNKNIFVANYELSFMLPVRTNDVTVLDGEIALKIKDSIMVYAPEGGIITECGESNFHTKYIKIMHNEHTFSIIDNLDVIGCNVGDIVKKGRELATAKQDSVIKLSIYFENQKIQNLQVEKNIISWT